MRRSNEVGEDGSDRGRAGEGQDTGDSGATVVRSGPYVWLLTRLVGPEESESVLRDLAELRAHRRLTQGRFRAWAYDRLESVMYPCRLAFDTLDRRRARNRSTVGPRQSTMRGLREDLGFAFRSVRRSPGFTLVAAAILSICIGANAAIFSVVKGVLLDSLPYPAPDRLAAVWLLNGVGARARMTPGFYTDLRSLDGIFEDIGVFNSARTTLTTVGGDPEILVGAATTASYFRTLGIRPAIGRTFLEVDEEQGSAPVVVLSHEVWTRRFGADPSIVGRLITLDGASVEVLGVMPRALYPMSATIAARIPFVADVQDFWVPLRYTPELWVNRRPHILGTVARLADGVSMERAQSAVEALSAQLIADAAPGAGETFTLTPFREEVIGGVRAALVVLMGAVGLVLLIATANVAGLMIVRTDARRREFAVRSAVGAARSRLARQTMFESAMLGLAGAAGGVLVAQIALSLIRTAVPFDIPRLADVGIDIQVLAFSLMAGMVAALVFGVIPATHASRESNTAFLGRSSRGLTHDGRRRRLHHWMVAIQAGLVVVVTVGATLLVRSFQALRSIDPGFTATETLVIPVLGDDPLLEELRDRFAGMAGVAAVALAYDHPLERNWSDSFVLLDRTLDDGTRGAVASLRPVGPDYFATVGVTVIDGREFTGFDRLNAPGVAVVNRALADLYFQGTDVLGQQIAVPTADRMFQGLPERWEIVGIVDNVRFLGLDGPAEPALYLPLAQFPVGGKLLVRPAGTPEQTAQLVAGLRTAVHDIDPTLAFPAVQSLDDNLRALLARPRFNMVLLASFAVLGLGLCGLGIYSLTGRAVASRVREIGIRSALGARRAGLLGTVIGGTLMPVIAGAAAGMLAAWALSQVLRSLLFDVSPRDPATFAITPVVVLLVAGLGALLPAIRALSISPTEALNSE